MYRGAAVIQGTNIYIIGCGSRTIYSYQLDRDKWNKHSQCPRINPGLVIINNVLTAVGGKDGDHRTNELLSWKHSKWMDIFPPLQTPHESPAVVHYGNYVIAVGGDLEEREVEVLHIPSLLWSTVTSLPRPLTDITATLCHDNIIAMDWEGSGYSINIESLVSLRLALTEHSQWMPLSKCPVNYAGLSGGPTLTTFSGQCLVVSHNGIFQLQNRQWVRIEDMSVPMEYCIVCVVCDQMVVVGGHDGYLTSTDDVRVAVIV